MTLNAILPIFLLIVFGYALKRFNFTDGTFWGTSEKLIYYIFFPALLISKLSSTELSGINVNSIAITTIASLIVISLLCLAIRSRLNIKPASFASIFQGSIRFNSYIGLALISALFDEQSLAIIILIAAINIPIVNVFSITVLHIHKNLDSRSQLQAIDIIFQIFKNPLILGCIIGVFINLLNLPKPQFIFGSVQILGSIALPLGLMAVGSALQLKQMTSAYKPLITSCIIKLILYPCVAYLIASIVGIDQLTKSIIVIFSALPTATSSYILAKSLQSDHQLMARIITIETLLSCVTLLLILELLGIN